MKSKATGTALSVASERKDGGELDGIARALALDPDHVGETCELLWQLGEKAADANPEECAEDWQHLTPATWDDRRNSDRIPAELAFLHADVSAAFIAFQKNDLYRFNEELASVLLRTMEIANRLGIDLGYQALRRLACLKSPKFARAVYKGKTPPAWDFARPQ